MKKTTEELKILKQEYETLNNKLNELNEDELKEVCAGVNIWDIAVKLKDKFNITSSVDTPSKNKSLGILDEASAGLINDPENSNN